MAYPKPSDADPIIDAELSPGKTIPMRLSEARRRRLRIITPKPPQTRKRTLGRNKAANV